MVIESCEPTFTITISILNNQKRFYGKKLDVQKSLFEKKWRRDKNSKSQFEWNSTKWILGFSLKEYSVTYLLWRYIKIALRKCVIKVIYYGFWPKLCQNPYFSIDLPEIGWRYCDVVFDCIVMNFFYKFTLVLFYFMPKLFEIECRLHG